MLSYNGYDSRWRNRILRAYHRGEAGPDFTLVGKVCALCGDPDRKATEWHSEDYSEPFLFEPPATYPMCSSCHGRLHKRFDQPVEHWQLFRLHVLGGGYGREFTKLYSKGERDRLAAGLATGEQIALPTIRPRLSTDDWWLDLSLDPESREAAWARPRPLRPRPDTGAFSRTIGALNLADQDRRILRAHAAASRRSLGMQAIALAVLGGGTAQTANLIYGKLAKKLCQHLQWIPDRREDGSEIWMSVVAEGWQPSPIEGKRRDYEWVMVPSLAAAVEGGAV